MTNHPHTELEDMKRDIIAAVANETYEQLKNDAPYINMTFEEAGAVCRDIAVEEVNDFIKAQDKKLFESLLAEMPERTGARWGSENAEVYRAYQKGFNQALDLVTELIKSKMEQL